MSFDSSITGFSNCESIFLFKASGIIAEKYLDNTIDPLTTPLDKKLGLKRSFVIAAQHPQWGAEMAEACGSSDLTVTLIHYHQEENVGDLTQPEQELLAALKEVDDKS